MPIIIYLFIILMKYISKQNLHNNNVTELYLGVKTDRFRVTACSVDQLAHTVVDFLQLPPRDK